jgi:hypothetical protein
MMMSELERIFGAGAGAAAKRAWADYDRSNRAAAGMSSAARQDRYGSEDDPFERAAMRTRRAVQTPGGRPQGYASQLAGDLLLPKTPLDYGLLALGGPLPRAAKTAAVGLGALFSGGEAQAPVRDLDARFAPISDLARQDQYQQ